MKEIHIANTPTKIDGTARCAERDSLSFSTSIEVGVAGGSLGVAGGSLGAGEEVGTDTIAADTTLEMEVRPCVNTNLCLK